MLIDLEMLGGRQKLLSGSPELRLQAGDTSTSLIHLISGKNRRLYVCHLLFQYRGDRWRASKDYYYYSTVAASRRCILKEMSEVSDLRF